MKSPADSQADREAESANQLLALLQAVQSRNRDAFERLYDATVQRVFSLALRITQQQALAEEVVSDVYLQVWQQAGSYTPERGKVIAWLCVLCRSRALDALRRDHSALRQAQIGLDTAPEPQDRHDPPELLLAVEQGSAVHTALGELSQAQRQLVALAYFKGYTHKELATIAGMPLGTVKTHLHRAMIRLKELIPGGDAPSGSDE